MTTPKKSVEKSVLALEPQPHGGQLRRGGPSPGSGRRPSQVRAKALKMFARRLHLVGAIADGVAVQFEDGGALKLISPRPGERLQALKLLAELGLGEQVAVSEVRERMRTQLEVLRTQAHWETEELIAALTRVWA
jgi:hypothetical protein